MPKVKLRVVSGSHSYKEDGRNVFVKKGDEFYGDESLLISFGDKIELVEEPPKTRGRPKKSETVKHGESDGDGSPGDSDNESDGRAD